MSLTIEEAAAKLNGNEYREEGSQALFAAMKEAGLVAVFGASDDLAELRGAIDDEEGCYDGGTIYLTPSGLLKNECEDEDCPYFERDKAKARTVEAVWGEGDVSWSYKTDIPHATFSIMEDGDVYCIGIVFALSAIGAAP